MCQVEDDIIIFPNWLRHTVYAHYEANHVRVSVAGNVNILNVQTEDNKQNTLDTTIIHCSIMDS